MIERLALEARGVSKRYGIREALCEVDLIAYRGRVHGLLGPNGAGNTTLMRVLLGLVRRDAGTVRLLGADLSSTAESLPARVAGFVETPAFYPYLSGRRNLALLARLDDANGNGPRESVDALLEQVGLSAHAHAAVAGYSAGMRQRLGLAAALLRVPQLLFLDEPTNSLDPGGARDVRTLARRLAKEGAAVVWSSHDMAEVEELCGMLTVINHGRVVFCGTVDDLRKRAPTAVHTMRTSDDRAAFDVASHQPGVKLALANGDLELSAETAALDAYVVALGRAGIAVRALNRRTRSLESLFLDLTGHPESEPALCSSQPAADCSRDPLMVS